MASQKWLKTENKLTTFIEGLTGKEEIEGCEGYQRNLFD